MKEEDPPEEYMRNSSGGSTLDTPRGSISLSQTNSIIRDLAMKHCSKLPTVQQQKNKLSEMMIVKQEINEGITNKLSQALGFQSEQMKDKLRTFVSSEVEDRFGKIYKFLEEQPHIQSELMKIVEKLTYYQYESEMRIKDLEKMKMLSTNRQNIFKTSRKSIEAANMEKKKDQSSIRNILDSFQEELMVLKTKKTKYSMKEDNEEEETEKLENMLYLMKVQVQNLQKIRISEQQMAKQFYSTLRIIEEQTQQYFNHVTSSKLSQEDIVSYTEKAKSSIQSAMSKMQDSPEKNRTLREFCQEYKQRMQNNRVSEPEFPSVVIPEQDKVTTQGQRLEF